MRWQRTWCTPVSGALAPFWQCLSCVLKTDRIVFLGLSLITETERSVYGGTLRVPHGHQRRCAAPASRGGPRTNCEHGLCAVHSARGPRGGRRRDHQPVPGGQGDDVPPLPDQKRSRVG